MCAGATFNVNLIGRVPLYAPDLTQVEVEIEHSLPWHSTSFADMLAIRSQTDWDLKKAGTSGLSYDLARRVKRWREEMRTRFDDRLKRYNTGETRRDRSSSYPMKA